MQAEEAKRLTQLEQQNARLSRVNQVDGLRQSG
jgi:hypothetical protein